MPAIASDTSEQGPRSTSTIARLLDDLASRPDADPEFVARLRAVGEILARHVPGDYFLTVIMRTQGRRIEPLKDALLSLQGQTDQDFEVVLLVHDAFDEDLAEVRSIVDRQLPSLAARMRVEEVVGGSRGTPLNVGIGLARGRYVAVFDDDDLVSADWVETFRSGAENAPGRLVRSVVAVQDAAPEMWPGDQDGFRSVSWPRPEYPATFDPFQHLLINHSPFMSWAFPRELFERYGLRFDESLSVCEDWDVILQGSLLCGVESVERLTAIYRRWQGAASSYTLHSSADWLASERRVIDRIDAGVLTLPPGSMQLARRLVLYTTALDSYRFLFAGHELRFPLNRMWSVARPGVKLAVRIRNRMRRLLAR